jgi:hypothetical protein
MDVYGGTTGGASTSGANLTRNDRKTCVGTTGGGKHRTLCYCPKCPKGAVFAIVRRPSTEKPLDCISVRAAGACHRPPSFIAHSATCIIVVSFPIEYRICTLACDPPKGGEKGWISEVSGISSRFQGLGSGNRDGCAAGHSLKISRG